MSKEVMRMNRITVQFRGKRYAFRPCDTQGRTQEEVQKLTDEFGYMQYEPHAVWLLVPGVGYAWETENDAEVRE